MLPYLLDAAPQLQQLYKKELAVSLTSAIQTANLQAPNLHNYIRLFRLTL
jgi:hypothetical protein